MHIQDPKNPGCQLEGVDNESERTKNLLKENKEVRRANNGRKPRQDIE